MSDAEAWRVAVLDEHTAGTGLFQGVRCAFAVANYWTYGYFEPRDHCELPGLLLRTRASADAPHAFFAPGFEGQPYRYRPSELPAYVSWTVELPAPRGEHGRPALVMPRPGPWEIWAEPHPDRVDWHVRAQHRGRRIHRTLRGPLGDKHTMHVEARPAALRVTAPGGATVEVEHDACAEPFMVTFGSGAAAGGRSGRDRLPGSRDRGGALPERRLTPARRSGGPARDGRRVVLHGQRGDARPSAPQRGRPGRAVRRFPAAGLERLPCRQGLGRIAGPAERAPVDRRRAHLEPHVDGGGGRARHQRHVRQPAEPRRTSCCSSTAIIFRACP